MPLTDTFQKQKMRCLFEGNPVIIILIITVRLRSVIIHTLHKGDDDDDDDDDDNNNNNKCRVILGPPLWSSGQSFWLQIQRFRVRSPALPDFL